MCDGGEYMFDGGEYMCDGGEYICEVIQQGGLDLFGNKRNDFDDVMVVDYHLLRCWHACALPFSLSVPLKS